LPMFNNLSGERKGGAVGLTTENNTEAKRKKKTLKKKARYNQSPKLILN
jgi:hypothetical protein